MFNEDFSHGKKFNFDSSNLEYITLDNYIKDGYPSEFTVKAVFINNKSKFGPRAVIVSDRFNINVPKHLNNDISKILSNQMYIDAINAGKCGFRVSQYEDNNHVIRNSGNFYDIT